MAQIKSLITQIGQRNLRAISDPDGYRDCGKIQRDHALKICADICLINMVNVKRLLPVLLLFSCAPREQQPGLEGKLDAFFSSQVPDGDGPGGAILVLKDTSVVYLRARGLADLQT